VVGGVPAVLIVVVVVVVVVAVVVVVVVEGGDVASKHPPPEALEMYTCASERCTSPNVPLKWPGPTPIKYCIISCCVITTQLPISHLVLLCLTGPSIW